MMRPLHALRREGVSRRKAGMSSRFACEAARPAGAGRFPVPLKGPLCRCRTGGVPGVPQADGGSAREAVDGQFAADQANFQGVG